MEYLNWIKCQGEAWCRLDTVNLSHEHFNNMEGVYVIWHAGPTPRSLYVGQGVIRDRLSAHRTDSRIQHYAQLGLFATWASLLSGQRNGAEAYLAQRLGPLVGELHPNVPLIEVNLPW
jgi:hypothetical protein